MPTGTFDSARHGPSAVGPGVARRYNRPVTRAERFSSTALRLPGVAFAAVGVNLALTLPLAAILNIWQDEAYTLHTTGGSVAYAFAQAIRFEQNAPLYFVALALWRHLGGSVFHLRLFSVACIALTVALMPALARRYLPRVRPLLVAGVAACNPFMVWAAVEMRVYALIVLVSALLLLTFYDAFADERPSLPATIAYGCCVAVALYTQYYLAFLIAAQALVVAVYYRRRLLAFLVAGGAGAAAFVPLLAIVPGQVANFKDGFAAPSLPHALVGLAGILLRYVLPLPVAHSKLLYAGIVVALVVAMAIVRPKRAGGDGPLLLMTGAAAALFALGTYAFGVHVLDRHAASLYLPATLSVFAFAASLQKRTRLTLGWSALVIVLSLLVLGRTYGSLAKPGDWPRVASYIRDRESGGEPIVVFEAENALPFAFYYRGRNAVVPVPHGVDFRRYRVGSFVIHGSADLEASMPASRRVWLVTAGACTSANVQFGCGFLERFVAHRYRVVSDAGFFGAEVRLLERKSL